MTTQSPKPKPQVPSEWKRTATEALLTLRAAFPQCFARLDLPRRSPLKIGINSDIAAALPEMSPVAIGRGLPLYVNHRSYLTQCIEGASRIDLDGNAAGAVSATEAEYAKSLLAQLAKRRQKQQKPKAKATPAPSSKPKLTVVRRKMMGRRQ